MEAERAGTVLVVEDNASMRELVHQVLAGAGHRVLLASTYAEARAAWEGERDEIDLLLTDLVLPDRSGTELANELVDADPALRVLVMSGYGEEEMRGESRWRDRGTSIRKPFDVRELARRVDELLAA